MERIDEDLDLHAKKKKLLRLADAQFLAGQTPDLPKLSWGQSSKHRRSQRQEDHRGPAMEEPALPTGTGRAQRDRVTGLHFEKWL